MNSQVSIRFSTLKIIWNRKTITIVTQKTKQPLELPLLDDIGWAVIDYLKNGRPKTKCNRLFIRHRAPFDAFGENESFYKELHRYMRAAGIVAPSGVHCGLHSLRSTLAKKMLETNASLPVISETLGHRNINTTSIYLKTDVEGLRRCAHISYIFTEKEMKEIFTAIDTWDDSFYTNRTLIDPVLFRLLYGTGLRISEALNLMVQDYYSKNGIITVYHAKNNKDRLVSIAPSITKRIDVMVEQMHKYSKDTDYLFATLNQGRMDSSTVYRRFRQYLLRAVISHGESGPRVHDFRHNFAVKCLKRWVLSGNELTNTLPYLAAYMGHSDFRWTQYYLRLTADLYPDIVKRLEIEFGYIIPEGGLLYEGN